MISFREVWKTRQYGDGDRAVHGPIDEPLSITVRKSVTDLCRYFGRSCRIGLTQDAYPVSPLFELRWWRGVQS